LVHHSDVRFFMLSDWNLVMVLREGSHKIVIPTGATVGLFPISDSVRNCTTQGLKWNLSKLES